MSKNRHIPTAWKSLIHSSWHHWLLTAFAVTVLQLLLLSPNSNSKLLGYLYILVIILIITNVVKAARQALVGRKPKNKLNKSRSILSRTATLSISILAGFAILLSSATIYGASVPIRENESNTQADNSKHTEDHDNPEDSTKNTKDLDHPVSNIGSAAPDTEEQPLQNSNTQNTDTHTSSNTA